MKKVSLVLALAGLFVSTKVHATLINETFTTNPGLDGWQAYGDTNLFQWDSASQVLDVTWDSSQTNSYYYHPLGVTLTTNDSFCVQFDLNLTDANAVGYFELAIGLFNLADATSADFSRANAVSPNLFEFDYYPGGPDQGGANSYGPSIDATLVDTNSFFNFIYDDTQPLQTGVLYHIVLIHQAGTSAISGVVYTNGQVMTSLPLTYNEGTGDFQLDSLAIESYTTTDDSYGDSLLAHGTVDNLVFASPLPIGLLQTPTAGKVEFTSDTNWLYTLEQSPDFNTWTVAAPASMGNGTNLVLQATNLTASPMFYQVRADLP